MRAGLNLVPVSFTGESEGVAVDNVGVSGIPVELILPEERQQAMDRVKAAYPGLVIIDFTLPTSVNGAATTRLRRLVGPAEARCKAAHRTLAMAGSALQLSIFGGSQHAAACQAMPALDGACTVKCKTCSQILLSNLGR